LPRDPAGRAKARALALAVACEIHPLCNLGVLERIQELAGPDKRGAWNRDTIARGLAAVDAMLDHPGFSGRFCLGGTAGLADCVLVPQLYNATRWGVSFDHLPRLGAVARACAKHPAFAVAHPDNFDPARSGGGT
jgi:maleylacetoacetate isomerase